ncbi:MAG: hypothetical protein IJG40_05980 [Oscillospiraceae bacterium]|nr:hypothetical protein [Oscillospiraceae bacterium]
MIEKKKTDLYIADRDAWNRLYVYHVLPLFCLYMDNQGLGTKALPFYPHSEFFFVYGSIWEKGRC